MYAKNAKARIDSPHCLKGELGVSNGALPRGTCLKSWNDFKSAELEIRYPQKSPAEFGTHIQRVIPELCEWNIKVCE